MSAQKKDPLQVLSNISYYFYKVKPFFNFFCIFYFFMLEYMYYNTQEEFFQWHELWV